MSVTIPKHFLESVCHCKGFDEEAFVDAHQTESPTSIRINLLKQTTLNFEINAAVKWSSSGFYLKQRPNFTYDPLFQAGCYYVQEAGSMFIEQAIRQTIDLEQKILALDLCGAPGGKSTLIASLINSESVLVANEVIKPRAEILSQNLTKWGVCNVVVTNNDPKDFDDIGEVFDLMMIDAPCSGSGLFRKQQDAIEEWSLENVNLCSQRQKRILADALPSLNEDGVLIYSTCSYSKSENEDVLDWLMEQGCFESIQLSVEESWGIIESRSDQALAYGYRFYPDKTQSEGFFCAVLRKIAKTKQNKTAFFKNKKHHLEPISKKESVIIENWIEKQDNHVVMKFKDDVLLMNSGVKDVVNYFQGQLYFKKVGTRIGTILKEELIPHHDLALSVFRNQNITSTELTQEQFLLFYKKQNMTIDGSKGWNLLTYHGFGLGWVKNLGNRLNNYLPNEFKILH